MSITTPSTTADRLFSEIHDGPTGWTGVDAGPEWAEEIRRLAAEKNATILAHNYQLPAIQDIAHHVGDSLALSRIAAEAQEETIVFCGVHFMAETAKILSPSKTVLIPDAVVVSYVNTTAEVKGLTDICCTSSNAVEVVQSIDPDREVL
ncbi:quinolinate synthase NadA, partial [Rhodococcoides corynebacterioides]